MKQQDLSWKVVSTPAELRPILTALSEAYPIEKDGLGRPVVFRRTPDSGLCEVRFENGVATINYGSVAQAIRGAGAVLSGLASVSRPYVERTPFETLGIMLDCSRNAVMTPEHIKVWLRRLALLGYNMVMLYTEDTYCLPDEPYFGYQRGAYSSVELREIVRYATKLGIEVVPCIQTLGHLEHILKHAAYWKVRDTTRVMMVGEKETYALIDKMVAHWSRMCKTRRIHIGMDETHDLGRGRYLDLHGYRNGFELFNEHLGKVTKICRTYGMQPMIWSDMYFRLGCKSGGYYDASTSIPDSVVRKIPKQAQLVYWDYEHADEAFYRDWIGRHREMGKEPLMASGIWTWKKYWYDHRITERNAGACVDACYAEKVKEIFFTQWGDDGAYCDHDSAFAGMVYCADKAYGNREPEERVLASRFSAVCGGSYVAHHLAGDIHGVVDGFQPHMWDDPLFETRFRTFCSDDLRKMAKVAEAYRGLAQRLRRYKGEKVTGNLAYAYGVAVTFSARYALCIALLRAYRKRDMAALRRVARTVPGMVSRVQDLGGVFREMWLSHNKPEGMEMIQAHFGMLETRYREMQTRIGEFVSGEVDCIAELDYKCPPK